MKIQTTFYLVSAFLLLQSQVSIQDDPVPKELHEIKGNEAKAVEAYFHVGSGSIQGSLCLGGDCVSAESFGFDTQRFKENNLRIHFDDTSTSASFPANDWRILINDSSNGGGKYFAVEDVTGGRMPFKIEAGARSNALYVDSQGDVGIGTSTPATDLEIKIGDTPTVRLQQDGTSGFTPQTWDMAGNETNFFIRDVTNGNILPFRIRPSAPANSLFVNTNGDIGMGTSSPSGPLHIRRSSTDLLILDETGKLTLNDSLVLTNKGIKFPDGSIQTIAFGGSNGAYTDLDVTGTAHFQGDVYVKGTVFPSASFSPSDERLKGAIKPITDATEVINQLFPKTFLYKEEYKKSLGLPGQKQYGLIAQEVERILPDLVKNFMPESGMEFKSVNYDALVPLLIQAFKEQQVHIESLERKVSTYASLEARLNALENKSNNTSNAKR